MNAEADLLTHAEVDHIDRLVTHYRRDLEVYRTLTDNLRNLVESSKLKSLCHSVRWRVKDPEHLRDKLRRKLIQSKQIGQAFDVSIDTLFEVVNDLSGIRLLHLHTSQFESIHAALVEVLEENRFTLIEGPEAKTWDDEYREYFQRHGVKVVPSKRMYTSVHYVITPNTRTRRTAEIQVRTLAEELWGEVDHTINYPVPSTKLTCREQIKVLARLTSTCTRLVDSIFASEAES